MAALLDRLGRFSARHRWSVVGAWVLLLAIAGGAFALFGGTLSSTFDIPGTATDKVTTQLERELGKVGGATGTIVFRSADGTALSSAQQKDIAGLLDRIDRKKGSPRRSIRTTHGRSSRRTRRSSSPRRSS
ncbi:hypothetical protein GCM10025881_17000 [Pseudolysinimonas kribbensis]|uniref:Membrane transport protein MMPL domain-containing protein n=1 Tax=Pseudolysinimonas kribbensis TaxID=433641 RepID=A0ABQ6K575_9MICO|nr:hypothetical protein GCM10025881_17000 [Pseudolysinimonas kribbensis]